MSKLESALQDATGVTPAGGKNRADYLRELAETTNNLPDNEYDALPPTAKKWVERAMKAIEGGRGAPEFVSDNGAAREEDAVATKPGKSKKKGGSKSAKADAVPAKKGSGKKTAKPEKERKTVSAATVITELALTHPDWKPAKITAELERRGIDAAESTVNAVRSYVIRVVKVQKRLASRKG